MGENDVRTNTKYAGFWIRLLADVIDSIILNVGASLVVLMVLGGFYWVGILFERVSVSEISIFENFNAFLIQIALVLIRFLLSLAYYTVGTYRYGTTIGKRCFRIYVVNYNDRLGVSLHQSFIRFLGYTLSYIPFCAGFFMIAFQSEKRGLHDFVAGTVCIIKKPKSVSPPADY